MTQETKRRSTTKMVQPPFDAIIPERDADKIPVLESRHLGIEFIFLSLIS